jgi:hypothetical protein
MVMAWNIPNEDLQALRKAIEDGLSLERVLKVERVNDDSTGISIADDDYPYEIATRVKGAELFMMLPLSFNRDDATKISRTIQVGLDWSTLLFITRDDEPGHPNTWILSNRRF